MTLDQAVTYALGEVPMRATSAVRRREHPPAPSRAREASRVTEGTQPPSLRIMAMRPGPAPGPERLPFPPARTRAHARESRSDGASLTVWVYRAGTARASPVGSLVRWQEGVRVVAVQDGGHVQAGVCDRRSERVECDEGGMLHIASPVSGFVDLVGAEVAVAGVVDGRHRE